MDRGYQLGFSDESSDMFDESGRQKKAATMVSVLSDYFEGNLEQLSLLNVGGSSGIIDEYLSRFFNHVTGIDIDENAIAHAKKNFNNKNLHFEVGDAMDMQFTSNSFDVIVCSQVYEHVPNANVLMDEIYRVLKPGGVVYFAAGNRIMFNEPHYDLPLLSVLPRPLSHLYLKLLKRGDMYYEKHLTYWGLKKLVKNFKVKDFTPLILNNPEKYKASYMLEPGSLKQRIAVFISTKLSWLTPGYIWILKKPMR